MYSKSNNILNSFNLYNQHAVNLKLPENKANKNSANSKKVIQLHFVNPNIMFLDIAKTDKVYRTKTAMVSKKRQINKQNRISTCSHGARCFNFRQNHF